MKFILHELSKRDDGLIEMSVARGSDSAAAYLANYNNSDPKFMSCNVDTKLFMLLSNEAFKRFGNCTIYQFELMNIIGAFARGEQMPVFPLVLGSTDFVGAKPGLAQICWNKLWIFLRRTGFYRPREISLAEWAKR